MLNGLLATKMGKILLELLNATLVKRPLNEEVIKNTTGVEWQRCFDLALGQQVLAMTFPAMSALPKEQRSGFVLWSKWMAYAHNIAAQSMYKREVVRKLGGWLAEDGLSTMIIKGFSLAVLYPQPDLREFCDIDIFSGTGYEAVNACFRKHGVEVGKPDGHHARLTVDGVAVEHHHSFSNSRVRQGNAYSIEEVLQRLAINDPRPTALLGICFPCPTLTALYTGWHAYKHFMHEKIELRHVIDWALALRQLTADEAEEVGKVKETLPWGRFADTMTAIALHRIALPQEWFPEREVAAARCISSEQEERVWNDIITAPHIATRGTTLRRRVMIGRRLMKNRWKFNFYASISAERFVWEEFVGYVNRKNEVYQRLEKDEVWNKMNN